MEHETFTDDTEVDGVYGDADNDNTLANNCVYR